MNPDKKQWLKELPEVKVKPHYVDHPAGPAKGEGVDRGTWPVNLKQDFIEMPEFKTYLSLHLNKKTAQSGRLLLNIGRALGAIAVEGGAAPAGGDLSSIKTLVALYTSG
eukprot:11016515-Lingulodinium_polyedra.AAC.1